MARNDLRRAEATALCNGIIDIEQLSSTGNLKFHSINGETNNFIEIKRNKRKHSFYNMLVKRLTLKSQKCASQKKKPETESSISMEKSWASRARLFKEYKEVQREKAADPDIQLVCDDSNIFKWTALIKGPSETPYEGGVFQLAFAVPEQYPLQPPQVRFLTKIFHPNVHFKTGEICLDILKNAWSPAWTLQSVCRAIIALMAHPEPDSPLNCDSGNLLRSGDVRGYQSMARMYTRLAAMPKKG
ncbi:Ubiquitin-conjugating enzyme, E2 [Corchorus capsularis]|uniref:E2 ubiquitin-conjugating enzyme n=1 Tax=Corchorus capsularis TaxID=210143 RepID=A0A1R3GV36_COCAP|nr:Ubiquitin-conjugating enzyme, E2 [Corchorus capsularis]